MTFRKATPEETKKLFGKELIVPGAKPPGSWPPRSTQERKEKPETEPGAAAKPPSA